MTPAIPRRTGPILVALGLALAGAPPASGQQTNPVYTDDSPVAADTFSRVADFVAVKNDAEAVRELQKLLDEQPDRLVAVQGQPDLFISVRARVHAVLLGSARLLEQYRAAEAVRAMQDLNAGNFEDVERSRLLTAAGFEAALRVAQTMIESGRFEAARLALEQLETHPDRRTPAGRDGAALLGTLARYLDRPEVRDRAARWASQSGAAAPNGPPAEAPGPLRQPPTTFFSPVPPLDADGIPPRALWSTPLEPVPIPSEIADAQAEAGDPNERRLWVLPAVSADTVYVNDGTFLTARDRFTLQPRWAIRPATDLSSDDAWEARREIIRPGQIEDTNSVTIQGRTLIATMGVAQQGERSGETATFAVDTASGRILWSADVPGLDPQLENASLRGPALTDGGVVVVAARKSSQGRRIVSFYLAGLSAQNGKLEWLRPLASAGSIPWGRGDQRLAPAPILHEGVVYCTDHLGVIAAVEAATGRPVWVRRAPVPSLGGPGVIEHTVGYTWSSPVPDGAAVIVIAPDRSELLRLDRATGLVLARRAASELGHPWYLLRIGKRLAAVAGGSIAFLPLGQQGLDGVVRSTRQFVTPGIRARVVVSGDRLLVPRNDGVAVINPDDPTKDEKLLALDHVGNILPLQSQLLVIDGERLHSYLTWTVAERLLHDRMTADPADADPAITYADLAFRAGHPDQIVPAADKALAALDKAPASEGSRSARDRLFHILLDMAENTQRSWSAEPAAPVRTLPSRPGQPRRRTASQPDLPVLTLPHLAGVIERLGRAAQGADQRISHLMALGRLREAEGTPGLAAEAYQQVLGEPSLAAASWRTGGSSVRAELEATRRLRGLILERGADAYAPFEAEAAQALAAAGPSAPASDLERLARRYPAAAITPGIWARAADAHETAARPFAAIADLREGLSAAEFAAATGAATDPTMLGEIGGRLASRLRAADQIFAAAQVVSRLRKQYPAIALADHGTPIDAEALTKELVQRLAGLQRFPRIGPDLKADTQPMAGWSLMSPFIRDTAGRACEHVMMLSAAESKVALWGIPAAGAEAGAHLQMLWTRAYVGLPPKLLRLDPDSVYLFWEKTEAGDGAVIERISTVGGETRWRTENFRNLFPADDAYEKRAIAGHIETPLEGTVAFREVLVAMDEQAVAIVERSGRAAAFDPETGRLLWHSTTAVQQVHEIDVAAGSVVIGGAAPGARGATSATPIAVVIDERTGQVMHTIDSLQGPVRWLRIATEGAATLIIATTAQIDSFDLASARSNWSIVGGAAFSSLDGWVFGDRLFILDQNRTLFLASAATGQVADRPCETYEHLVGSGPIEATPIGPGRKRTLFTTNRGLCVIDEKGALVGMDAIDGGESDEGAVLHAAISEDYFVMVEAQVRQPNDPNAPPIYHLHILDTASGMLVATRTLAGLEVPPRRIVALDGRVLITAGANTVVYPAPEGDRR